MKSYKRTWFPLEEHRPAPQTAARAVPTPIDPLAGPRLALAGRVVTMEGAFTVRPDAVVYIDKGAIVAVQDRAAPRPAGFEAVTIV